MALLAHSADEHHVLLDLGLPAGVLPFSEDPHQLGVVLFVVLERKVLADVRSDQEEGDLVVVLFGVGLERSRKTSQEVDLGEEEVSQAVEYGSVLGHGGKEGFEGSDEETGEFWEPERFRSSNALVVEDTHELKVDFKDCLNAAAESALQLEVPVKADKVLTILPIQSEAEQPHHFLPKDVFLSLHFGITFPAMQAIRDRRD